MKKLILCLVTALFVLSLTPTDLKAGTEKDKATITTDVKTAPVDGTALIARLDQIQAMDISSLSSMEKRQLRREVRSIETTLNQLGGGYIVLGGGTLLLIIILLILLL